MTLPVPINRTELYLAKIAGEDVTIPDRPINNTEVFLARLAGADIVLPTPINTLQVWLAILCGELYTMPPVQGAELIGVQMVRTEFLAASAGLDGVTTPTPENRAEEYWAKIAEEMAVQTITVKGTSLHLLHVVSGIDDLQYVYGDTEQAASPNPDYPQDVHVVTGEQVVNVHGGSSNTDYSLTLGSLELCKIGDYQDYIYKSGDDWYVHKEIGKVTFTGGESWTLLSVNTRRAAYYSELSDMKPYTNGNSLPNFISDRFIQKTGNSTWTAGIISCETSRPTYAYLCVQSNITTVDAFKTWLSTHNTAVYYVLATPTDTQITDATLVSQLNALDSATLPTPEAFVTVSGNLPAPIQFTYQGKL